MQAWNTVGVPRLPGNGERPAIHDTVSGSQVVVGPESGTARSYACGITPYDATHLGHAFTYVCVDLLHRVWLDAGLDVHYAQNITDVDDPLLQRAAETGADWRELAASQVDLFVSDMSALRVLPPSDYLGVVESLEDVVAAIAGLRERGAVYQLPGGDWYFAVESDAGFLAGRDLAADLAVFAERGGDPDRGGKRHRLDPLVWRAERPGEPSWPSELGPGRPGWHVECTAIAIKALGNHFDVQAGGSDLAFPHHPMCASQALVLTGEPFATAYFHVGMVGLDGEKMSKSRGNLVFVHRLLAGGADPMAVRLALLAHHYRQDWEYTPKCLAEAATRLDRWRSATGTSVSRLAELRQALADDLNTPAALAIVDEWAAAGGGTEMLSAVDALLGVR
ncbi:MAG: cysteine--1-D-myo-inosityl 2-amino-2-deoxy-alpha-D-glucopyranoside ligase [Propionibacteriaceae bacterium]|jgi:L-cysteine:1D-myo-inositol 2-amino-2-deoxy-alpha-D-glucopyranoside ligase|nr:cysteine--1-D-myo-inosityl 2-amino-2-deoxy-alpha-D-glucopyranoside ligase [Propionibacteriaceae bacterium]